MRVIRVETSAATILLTEAPQPKVRDRQTGEIAKDTVTGEALMTVGVVYIDEGESSLIHVTVPKSGVAEGLALGAPVSLPGLVARPWESVFNGQQRHGIAYPRAPPSLRPPSRPDRGPDRRVRPADAAGGGRTARRAQRWRRLPPGPAPGRVLVHGRPARLGRPACWARTRRSWTRAG